MPYIIYVTHLGRALITSKRVGNQGNRVSDIKNKKAYCPVRVFLFLADELQKEPKFNGFINLFDCIRYK